MNAIPDVSSNTQPSIRLETFYLYLSELEADCKSCQAEFPKEARTNQQLIISNEQWCNIIQCYTNLFDWHYDFLITSQFTATEPTRRLPTQYDTPTRLWKYGIHPFLKFLRKKLPISLDLLIAFTTFAYHSIALLLETVPQFEDAWIEYLGEISRFRTAIYAEGSESQKHWRRVARQWYRRGLANQLDTGRLYLRLAKLGRNSLERLYWCGKALLVSQPLDATRKSIHLLFGKHIKSPMMAAYVKANAALFTHNGPDFEIACRAYTSTLDGHIASVRKHFLKQGHHIAISNIVALFSFGSADSILSKTISSSVPIDFLMAETINGPLMFKEAQQLFNDTTNVILKRVGDSNVLSYLHVLMVFLNYIAQKPGAMPFLVARFPMQTLVTFLNSLARCKTQFGGEISYQHITGELQPVLGWKESIKGLGEQFRPYPEEVAMRGLFWADGYFSRDHFQKDEDDDKYWKHELSVDTDYRPEMILWLAVRFCHAVDWIYYDEQTQKFAIRD